MAETEAPQGNPVSSATRTRWAIQLDSFIAAHFGCYAAAVEIIRNATGRNVSEGTLSKRKAGQIGWPIDEIVALEDAAGDHPVTRLMARRLRPAEAGGCLVEAVASAAKEAGEATSATMRVVASDCQSRSETALAEIDEAIAALRKVRATIEGQG